MTEQEQNLLDDFRYKLKQLLQKMDALALEKQQLTVQISQLNNELNTLRKENERLAIGYGQLKIARTFAPDESDRQQAKQKIDKLVREIDKCIAQLNK